MYSMASPECILLLAWKNKGSCPYAEWICGSPVKVKVSSYYPSPNLIVSVNEIILGLDENTLDLLTNVIKVLKNA